MKFRQPLCPECDTEAINIVELIPATVGIIRDEETGSYDYDGMGARINWDGQMPKVVLAESDQQPLVELGCGEHTWLTVRIYDPEDIPQRDQHKVDTFEAIVAQDLVSTTVNIPEE
jgi:hypothetical protein